MSEKVIDSLLKITKTTKIDSVKIDALRDIYYFTSESGKYNEAIPYIEKAIAIAKEKKLYNKLGKCYTDISLINRKQGNYVPALEYAFKAIEIFLKNNSLQGLSINYNNIGIIYKEQENFTMALTYFGKSLDIEKKLNNIEGITFAYGNLAVVQTRINNYDLALLYTKKVLDGFISLKYEDAVAQTYGNIAGIITEFYNEFDSVMLNNPKLNAIDKKILLDSAYHCALLAIDYQKKQQDTYSLSHSLTALGTVMYLKNNFDDAIKYCSEAQNYAEKMDNPDRKVDACNCLYKAWNAKNNYKKALYYFEKYFYALEEVKNKENTEELTRKEMHFNFVKKQMADSLLFQQEQFKKEQQIAKMRIYTYSGIGGLLLMLGIAIVLYRGYKTKQRDNFIISNQKQEVEHKNELLAEKNKEIMDSITYAKRIQEAILPSRYSLTENLSNGFVLYKPKDIVAGDFYWLEKFNNKIFFAAADCTGHGVPGAMVSVVCSNALSKALLEEGITNPGKLLDRTRELVVQKFSNSNESVKDGMDISLVVLNYNEGNSTNRITLQWAGANNPLWLVRKADGNNLIEVKPDKQPIGSFAEVKPFTTHQLDIDFGDMIYVFTDGYQDQFGGENGKKFKAATMKKLISEIYSDALEMQKTKFNTAFENWKGQLEQVDDVCVIGVRV